MDKERPPGGDLTNPAELQAATEQSRYDFLQTDLTLCLTFVDLVKTELELGDRAAAERIFSKASGGLIHSESESWITGSPDTFSDSGDTS